MKNFMRYKGENTIEFSCDSKKNVTVVLGDNTVEKTTIARAFRFGLYGAISTDRRKSEEDDREGATKWGKLKSDAEWISFDYANFIIIKGIMDLTCRYLGYCICMY